MKKLNDGIILAGGYGKRLFPITKVVNKHFLSVFDKPMIYYSLSILLLFEIKNITIVCNPEDEKNYIKLLGDGNEFGVNINYAIQHEPEGLPHAINTGLKNRYTDEFMVILGDNFLYGRDFFQHFKNQINNKKSINIFYQEVVNPNEYGVAVVEGGKLKELIEKPENFISNKAIIGLYRFDNNFSELFKNLKKSKRNEFEILDIFYEYGLNNIDLSNIGRGSTWFDMGSYENYFNASLFVKTIQERQGLLVSSPHEIAFNNGFIDKAVLEDFINNYKSSTYANSLKYLID
mgnify:CR=1 FL=1